MKNYDHINAYRSQIPSVVTIGTFDGVHRGHQNILNRVNTIAQQRGLTSVLLTFFPHPRMVLQPDHKIKLINTIQERQQLVANTGIEHIITHPFSVAFSRTSAHDYVKNILLDQLNAAVVVIGYDHRFGRNRAASIEQLVEYGDMYDFEVIQISKKEIDEVAVSSTKIRQAIAMGNMQTAQKYLNRPYSVNGTIVRGNAIGRTLQYPTANLAIIEDYKLIPKPGVYITSSYLDGNHYYGMTNIGVNPTVATHNQQSIETYYLDYNGNLYDQFVELIFHKRLRDEVKFNSLEELKQAMQQDELNTRAYEQQM